MPLPAALSNLPLPIIGSPLFIISTPKLVIAQCTAGVVGSMPALNARPASQVDEWLAEITEGLAAWDKAHPNRKAAPYAINQIVHKSNDRLDHDMEMCAKYKVPVIITSLGARVDINEAVHAWGGVVLHDIINNNHAHKAVDKGADGLIAVAAGAGGHAGTKSPFALIQEIRQWFDGPLALSGSIATGDAVLAAQAMGADFAYIGSAFIATEEARAMEGYKQAIVDANSDDIVYSNLFTGVHGNYLKPSIVNAGLDPDNLPVSDPSKMNFGNVDGGGAKKAWRTSGAAARALAPSTRSRARMSMWPSSGANTTPHASAWACLCWPPPDAPRHGRAPGAGQRGHLEAPTAPRAWSARSWWVPSPKAGMEWAGGARCRAGTGAHRPRRRCACGLRHPVAGPQAGVWLLMQGGRRVRSSLLA